MAGYMIAAEEAGKAGLKLKKAHVIGESGALELKKGYVIDMAEGEKLARQFFSSQLPGSITPSVASLTAMVKANGKKSFTVTTVGDGALSAVSSDTSVATAKVSGTTVTVTCLKTGSATITVHMAESDNYTAASCEVALSVTVVGTLSSSSWATIAEVAAAGSASSCWAVGDTKAVSLNGTSYTFRIIGFNHDNLSYTITGYNGGKKKAAITFEMVELFTTTYYMNVSGTNAGGWNDSYMRETHMQTMKGYMPTALKNVLRTVSKKASAGEGSTTITTSADQLFLLSEIEVTGTASNTVAGEGSQYAYYKAGNSAVKNRDGSAETWWLRSPRTSSDIDFAHVSEYGSTGVANASIKRGLSFAFCV